MAASGNDQRIDYVEFLVRDIARSRRFYGNAFGWSFKDYGPAYCEFNDGRLTGGFALDDEASPASAIKAGGPLVILYAADLDATKARLEQAGAKIVETFLAVLPEFAVHVERLHAVPFGAEVKDPGALGALIFHETEGIACVPARGEQEILLIFGVLVQDGLEKLQV